MIIVSGKIFVASGMSTLFVEKSLDAVKAARVAKGCLDFVVAVDPIEYDRVNVYEKWESEDALDAFRGSGPASDISSLIRDAQVSQHRIVLDER